MIASALRYEKQPVGSLLKRGIKCDEVRDNCKMIHLSKQTDIESPLRQHMRVGAKVFD